jgi:hypothetical protein
MRDTQVGRASENPPIEDDVRTFATVLNRPCTLRSLQNHLMIQSINA